MLPATGVVGADSSNVLSPASARVDEGVMAPGPPISGSVAERRWLGSSRSSIPGELGGEDVRDSCGETDEPPICPEAVDESTLPAGLADLPEGFEKAGAGTAPEGIRFPIRPRPLVSDTRLPALIMPAVLGSSEGMRLPTNPPRAYDCEEGGGPDEPNGWFGTSGAAEGLLNFAMRSLSDPDTARTCGGGGGGGLDPEDPGREGGLLEGGVALG